MESVFVSYSHSDSDFVNRFIEDLNYASIPATYDRWLLSVGDSIIEKISNAVVGASIVIPVLSKNSVESNWVKKELSLAMTGEVSAHEVKVLPAKIDDCKLPPSLSDKLYADFTLDYYYGMRRMLEAISPETYSRYEERFHRKQSIDDLTEEFEALLGKNEVFALDEWLTKNSFVLAGLLGRLWTVSEAIKNFKLNEDQAVDYLVVNGQSFRYEFSAVKVCGGDASPYSAEMLKHEGDNLTNFIRACASDADRFRGLVSVRLSDEYGASQVMESMPHHDRFEIIGKILMGRRSEYDNALNKMRERLYNAKPSIEVISYDRILDVLKGLRRQ